MAKKIKYEYRTDDGRYLKAETRFYRTWKDNAAFDFYPENGPKMVVLVKGDVLLGKVAGVWTRVGRLTTGWNNEAVAFIGPDDVPTSWEVGQI